MLNKNKNEAWSSQKFIELSRALGEAFLPGLEISKSENKEDVFTMNSFLAAKETMNRNKTSDT